MPPETAAGGAVSLQAVAVPEGLKWEYPDTFAAGFYRVEQAKLDEDRKNLHDLQKMADHAKDAAKSLQDGKDDDAQDALEEMEEDLEKMDMEEKELDELEQALEDLDDLRQCLG